MAQTKYYKPWVDEGAVVSGGTGATGITTTTVGGKTVTAAGSSAVTKKKSYLWLIILAILLALAGLAALAFFMMNNHDPNSAVVWVQACRKDAAGNDVVVSSGSGVIVSANGYIITNHHVAYDEEHSANWNKIKIRLNSGKDGYRDIDADIAMMGKGASNGKGGWDPTKGHEDWALLKLKVDETNLPYLPIGESSPAAMARGSKVRLIGFPASSLSNKNFKGPSLDTPDGTISSYTPNDTQPDLIVHTCNGQGGDSGGALVNERNQLVGIHAAAISAGGVSKLYAIAIHKLGEPLDKEKIPHPAD